MQKMTEHQIQSAVVDYARHHPLLRDYYFAIPNGGSRHPAEAANLKRQGVLAGVPDTFLALPSGHYHGLFIECKSILGKLTAAQKNIIPKLKDAGYRVEVVKEPLHAINIINQYLEDRNVR